MLRRRVVRSHGGSEPCAVSLRFPFGKGARDGGTLAGETGVRSGVEPVAVRSGRVEDIRTGHLVRRGRVHVVLRWDSLSFPEGLVYSRH